MLVSVLARVWLARAVKTPWILIDEFLYSEQAKSFAANGNYWIRGAPSSIVSYLYPALISPAWWADSMRTTYGLAKAINSVLMTLVAVPVYLWGIRIAPRRYVFAAVALTLLLPAFFYTGELMTENAFFPAFVTSAFAIALALERPTLFRQGLMLAAMLATVAVRFQGIVLLAVLPTAVLLKLLFDLLGREESRPRRIVRNALLPFWPTAAAVVVAGGAYAAYKQHQGLGLTSGLGNYQGVVTGGYPIDAAARWTLYHFAELPLAFGYIPACAFLVLLGLGLTRARTFSAAERSFLAVTAAATILLVPEVGAFASQLLAPDRGAEHVRARAAVPAGALPLAGPRSAAAAAHHGRRRGAPGRSARDDAARQPAQPVDLLRHVRPDPAASPLGAALGRRPARARSCSSQAVSSAACSSLSLRAGTPPRCSSARSASSWS